MIIILVVRYFTMSLSFLMTLTISVRLQKLHSTLIHLSGHFLKPWIWMFVAWKYCREEDKRRINLVRKIFFAHFEANEKILYKAAKISAQEALKKQLENKWKFESFIIYCKLGCMVRMIVDSLLPHAESGPNDHRKDEGSDEITSRAMWKATRKISLYVQLEIYAA